MEKGINEPQATEIDRLCTKCKTKLESELISMMFQAYYCPNKKCKHFGLLTLGFLRAEKNKNDGK